MFGVESPSANTTLIGRVPLGVNDGGIGRRGMGESVQMDPSRKRVIRLSVALTAALLLATALVYVSFSAGTKEFTASQLLSHGKPGQTYELAGTVLLGSVRHEGSALLFKIRDPKLDVAVPVRYTGIVPDPFAGGRAVMVAVRAGSGTTYVGQENSLTTKCPSKYKAAAAS
jgi:cytochrome c-type biogenesis protein CcmE